MEDSCTHFYAFNGRFQCLHQIFRNNQAKIMTKETTPDGIQFNIYSVKPSNKSQAWKRGWWRNGSRARVREIGQIFLAAELADKHQVKKVRIKYGKIIQQ